MSSPSSAGHSSCLVNSRDSLRSLPLSYVSFLRMFLNGVELGPLALMIVLRAESLNREGIISCPSQKLLVTLEVRSFLLVIANCPKTSLDVLDKFS